MFMRREEKYAFVPKQCFLSTELGFMRKFPSTDVLRSSLHLRFKGNLFLIVWLLYSIL